MGANAPYKMGTLCTIERKVNPYSTFELMLECEHIYHMTDPTILLYVRM